MGLLKRLVSCSGLQTYSRAVSQLHTLSRKRPLATDDVALATDSGAVATEDGEDVGTKANDPHRHGDHSYDQLVPWRTGRQLAEYLLDNKLFEDKNVLVLNKPNKLARYSVLTQFQLARENDDQTHGGVCLNDAIPHLMRMTGTDFMDVTLGMHRDSSGIIVLSKRESYHERLRRFFKCTVRKDRHFLQTFWALTRGVPVPENGADRIGLRKEKVHGFTMPLLTKVSKNEAKLNVGQRPYLQYRTLTKSEQEHWQCALVQIEPTSTRWDSVQVYVASRLAPILGDHVYSARVSTVLGQRVLVKQTKCPPKIQFSL